jgi:hypothetical protein
MATSFPGSLDTFTTHSAGQVITSSDVNKIQDSLAAVEAKVGATSSAVTTSLDYLVTAAAAAMPAFKRSATSISTCHPHGVVSSTALVSGVIQWCFFTSPISFTTTQIRFVVTSAATSSTAGSGWGLYSVDASDNLTLLTTAVGTTQFTTGTVVTSNWAASQAITAGTRYAVGVLNVNGSGNPQLAGYSVASIITNELNTTPRVCSARAGQTVHATTAVGSLGGGSNIPYAVLL